MTAPNKSGYSRDKAIELAATLCTLAFQWVAVAFIYYWFARIVLDRTYHPLSCLFGALLGLGFVKLIEYIGRKLDA